MSNLFEVFHKPTGKVFGQDGFWEGLEAHLESHLLIGPTGRIFWHQFDGLVEMTDDCELRFFGGHANE